mgnify:CR=1 FL=1
MPPSGLSACPEDPLLSTGFGIMGTACSAAGEPAVSGTAGADREAPRAGGEDIERPQLFRGVLHPGAH